MSDRKLPPLAALRAFEAAARESSLSAAARELNVTHAAIAQHVKRLEQWFETPLLRRAGRGVQVTSDGEQFALELSRGFMTIQAATHRMTARRDTEPLRITTTPAFASRWLLPRLESFYRFGANTEIVVNPTMDVIDLENSDYDVAFRFGLGDWPGTIAEFVVRSPVVLVGSREFLAHHPVNKPEDLVNVPWVQEFGTDEVATCLARLGIVDELPHQILTLPAEYTLSAIREGRGIGINVAVWLKAELRSGELVQLFEAVHDENLGYYLAYRHGQRRRSLELFINWFRTQVDEQ